MNSKRERKTAHLTNNLERAMAGLRQWSVLGRLILLASKGEREAAASYYLPLCNFTKIATFSKQS